MRSDTEHSDRRPQRGVTRDVVPTSHVATHDEIVEYVYNAEAHRAKGAVCASFSLANDNAATANIGPGVYARTTRVAERRPRLPPRGPRPTPSPNRVALDPRALPQTMPEGDCGGVVMAYPEA